MDDVSRHLEDLIPPAERQGETSYFEIFESHIDTTLNRLRRELPTGVLSVSNKRYQREGAAIFYRGRCVGCSYRGRKTRNNSPWRESFAQLREDLEAADTVIGLCHLSIPFVVAISAVYLGRALACPETQPPSSFMDDTVKLLEDSRGTAALIAVDENNRIAVLLYFFKGSFVKMYRSDGSKMIPSDLIDLNEVLSSEKVQVTAFIQTDGQLDQGYGVPMFPFNAGSGDDDAGGSKVGARRRPPTPSGETSIALQLPKRNEEVEIRTDS